MITIEQIKEYIKCPQFGDSEYGKWGALSLEQRKAFKDLVTRIEEQDNHIIHQIVEKNNLMIENTNLVKRIDKAIELINYYGITPEENDDTTCRSILKQLFEILKGEDK